MSARTGPDVRPEDQRQWINLFEVTNRPDLRLPYRLVAIRGIPPGEHYDKQVNLLAKRVTYDLRQPAALLRFNGAHHLAIPAAARLLKPEYALTPHVATLEPLPETQMMDFTRLDDQTSAVAAAFLRHAFRAPLWAERGLWGTPRASYEKRPLNTGDRTHVDVYPGFAWNVIVSPESRVFLSVNMHVKYVDRRWLSEILDDRGLGAFRGRWCLYQYGHQWYIVQLSALTGQAIAAQRFVPREGDASIDVFTYTRRQCADNMPPWIRDLSPDSPAIIYRYPGNERDRYGALGLCKLTLSTEDAEAGGLHRLSILNPPERLHRTMATVERYFQRARLNEQPIRINPQPHEIHRRVFPVPSQRFGHDHVLRVRSEGTEDAGTIPLEVLGQRRLDLLLNPGVGPLDTSPFYDQYLVQPRSLPRSINDDFAERFTDSMRRVSGRSDYRVDRVLYDDRGATSLAKQVRAVRDALESASAARGYAALVLPVEAKPGLHNYLKRELWPGMQFKCATAGKLLTFYARGDDGEYHLKPALAGKLRSYMRNCAFGMMIVNRKWPWALAAPLHYDVHIGIDVLNGMAGFTFVYDNGRRIRFHNARTTQKERLTSTQMREVLVTQLTEDLPHCIRRPHSFVIERDGRSFSSELEGQGLAFRQLQRQGILVVDATWGVVDIRKATADHLRLFEGPTLYSVGNPVIGSHHALGQSGIVATTGWPFQFPGTANPLSAVIVGGMLRIDWVLEDLFALSQLVFSAPERCQRSPLTVALNDTFLEPISGDVDEEAALYDADPLEAPTAVEVVGGSNG